MQRDLQSTKRTSPGFIGTTLTFRPILNIRSEILPNKKLALDSRCRSRHTARSKGVQTLKSQSLRDSSSSQLTPGGSTSGGEGPEGSVARRTLQVTFTCNKCGARTERLVNPAAYAKGTVFVQCGGCENWHKLRDEAKLIDEIRFSDDVPP